MSRGAFCLLVCCLVSISICGFGSTNDLSAGRGLGVGARLGVVPMSIIPWPFLNWEVTDSFGVGVTGFFFPGLFGVSGSFEYRLVNGRSVDVLPSVALGIGSTGGEVTTSLTAGAIVELSFSESLAFRAAANYGTLALLTVSVSLIFYF